MKFLFPLLAAFLFCLPLRGQNAPAEPKLPNLSLEQFSALDYEGIDPYITQYFKQNPGQKGCEKVIRQFFQAHPPKVMMPELQAKTPAFYKSIKAKSDAALAGKKEEAKYSLEDFLVLPEDEHREIAGITGPGLYALLTDKESQEALRALAKKESRALEVVVVLVQMKAQGSSAEEFSQGLNQLIRSVVQMKQAGIQN